MKTKNFFIYCLLQLNICLGQESQQFNQYWFSGKAEISSFALVQARYGELRQGQAVLIFVTEDFSASRQVKLDRPQTAGADKLPILKLNATRKFNTGTYPYSMMTSVFSSLNNEGKGIPVKITCSSQEWCGHTFTQLNRRDEALQILQRSYFESEGDVDCDIETVFTEDGIWNLIRLAPDRLPLGDIQVLPAFVNIRLMHLDFKPYKTIARIRARGEDQMVYTLEYPELDRVLNIYFQKEFPFLIEGWEDSYPSGWGSNRKILTTTAKRNKTIQLDYWNKNRNSDTYLREKLGLE